MQIIESTQWAVRSVRLTLTHPSNPHTVVLFPMIHIGEAAFYDTVYADAFAQDVVLVEGVRSPIGALITTSYRWIEHNRNIGLVSQSRYRKPTGSKAKIILADLTREEFAQAWQTIPFWTRWLVYIAAPCIGVERRFFGSRESIAKGMSLEDAESQEELVDISLETGFISNVLLDARDERLLKRLNEQIDEPASEGKTIAVVYGAAHMRAVLRELTTVRGYRCASADWMTVFSL